MMGFQYHLLRTFSSSLSLSLSLSLFLPIYLTHTLFFISLTHSFSLLPFNSHLGWYYLTQKYTFGTGSAKPFCCSLSLCLWTTSIYGLNLLVVYDYTIILLVSYSLILYHLYTYTLSLSRTNNHPLILLHLPSHLLTLSLFLSLAPTHTYCPSPTKGNPFSHSPIHLVHFLTINAAFSNTLYIPAWHCRQQCDQI